jgi:hypothetical protein
VWVCGPAVCVPSSLSWAEVVKWKAGSDAGVKSGQRAAAPRGIDRSGSAAVAGAKGGFEIVHVLDAVARGFRGVVPNMKCACAFMGCVGQCELFLFTYNLGPHRIPSHSPILDSSSPCLDRLNLLALIFLLIY